MNTNEKIISKIMDEKEAIIIAATGIQADSITQLFHKTRGRSRALMRAGVWMAERNRSLSVSDNGIKSAASAAKVLFPHFDDIAGTEQILALMLDNRNRVIDIVCVSGKRQPSGCDLDLRELLTNVIISNASGIILAHNHPSGENNPSREDVMFTRDINGVFQGIGVQLIDHLIILSDGSYSRVNWAA